MAHPKGLIFDKDGTLFDFEATWTAATLNVRVGYTGSGNDKFGDVEYGYIDGGSYTPIATLYAQIGGALSATTYQASLSETHFNTGWSDAEAEHALALTSPSLFVAGLAVRGNSEGRDEASDDLAQIELSEIEVLEQYLPEQLSEDELDAMIEEVISATGAESIRDMGKVMGKIKGKAAGRADMGAVGARVKAKLGQ